MTVTGPRCLSCGEPTARPKSICVNEHCQLFGKVVWTLHPTRTTIVVLCCGIMFGVAIAAFGVPWPLRALIAVSGGVLLLTELLPQKHRRYP